MRESGILMHITSLPGSYGIGTMGRQAFAFVDFLRAAGQHSWQVLPLSPTGYGDSPYQSCSAYAGNHYLIDLEQLQKDRLLREHDLLHIHQHFLNQICKSAVYRFHPGTLQISPYIHTKAVQ